MYKAKLLGNTLAQTASNSANRILKHATIAAPLKYLSNFWRSLEMPLINCIVFWLQLVMIMLIIIDDVNGNNIVFTIKDKKSYVPVVTLSARGNQKLSKVHNKGF